MRNRLAVEARRCGCTYSRTCWRSQPRRSRTIAYSSGRSTFSVTGRAMDPPATRMPARTQPAVRGSRRSPGPGRPASRRSRVSGPTGRAPSSGRGPSAATRSRPRRRTIGAAPCSRCRPLRSGPGRAHGRGLGGASTRSCRSRPLRSPRAVPPVPRSAGRRRSRGRRAAARRWARGGRPGPRTVAPARRRTRCTERDLTGRSGHRRSSMPIRCWRQTGMVVRRRVRIATTSA